jgi:hypothetical protein
MKAYSIKKINDNCFSISFLIENDYWHGILHDIKSKLFSKITTHLKKSSIHRTDWGFNSSYETHEIKNKMLENEGKEIVIGSIKIKKGDYFTKRVESQKELYRKDIYCNFFITINPYSEKVNKKLNFKNPDVRDNIYEYFKSIYKVKD